MLCCLLLRESGCAQPVHMEESGESIKSFRARFGVSVVGGGGRKKTQWDGHWEHGRVKAHQWLMACPYVDDESVLALF